MRIGALRRVTEIGGREKIIIKKNRLHGATDGEPTTTANGVGARRLACGYDNDGGFYAVDCSFVS